jgi:hypothetical protein
MPERRVVLFLTVRGPGSTGAIPSPRYGARIFGSAARSSASGTRGATTGSGVVVPAPAATSTRPPARNFDFDTDFQLVQNLPPLTPQVTSVRQILFTENFR